MKNKLSGYTIVDSSGLILCWRGSAVKAWDRRDAYAARGVTVTVHATQLPAEQVAALERYEFSRGPIALSLQLQAQGAA